jgi:hypothetical protein
VITPPTQNVSPPIPKPKPPTIKPPAQNTSLPFTHEINTSGPVNSTGAPLFIIIPDLPSYTPLLVIFGFSLLFVGGVIVYIKKGDKGVEMEDPL